MRSPIRLAALALGASAPALALAQSEPRPTTLAAQNVTAAAALTAGASTIETAAAAPAAPSPAQPTSAPAAPEAAVMAASVVESGELQALDPWQVGGAGKAMLPKTLWEKSDAVAVGALFDKLGPIYASPAANRLARAVLLSPGGAPAGSDAAAGEAARKRFAALGRLGAAEDLAIMVSASPAAARDAGISMFAAQADLARGRVADACRRGQDAALTSPFFLRLKAFCFAASGDGPAADLAIEVARNGGVNDPWLFAAIPMIVNGAKPSAPAKYTTSLDAAASIAGGFRPAAKALANASLLAQGAVARAADQPPALRVEAAAALLKAGAIDASAARAALASGAKLKSTKSTPVSPLAAAVRAVDSADGGAARAFAIQSALNSLVTYSDYVAAARLFAGDIANLPKDETTAAAAVSLARAALAVGDGKVAAEWRNLAVNSQQAPPEAISTALDAALVAAGQGNAETAKVVLDRRITMASGLGLRRASRDVIVLSALGVPAPPPAAGFLNANPPVPALGKADEKALAAAVSASQRGAGGETAAYVAQALAPGADKVELDSVVTAIQALRAVGLMDAARIVAVEAMIAGGVA